MIKGVTRDADGELARSPYLENDAAFAEIARLGYDGIEIPMKLILFIGKDKFKEMMKKYNLRVIIMIFTDGPVVPGSGQFQVFGGPYEGFTAPSPPGETDKESLVKTHLAVFKVFDHHFLSCKANLFRNKLSPLKNSTPPKLTLTH